MISYPYKNTTYAVVAVKKILTIIAVMLISARYRRVKKG
jgi:hypothetical protein